jgi:hypothetical protein
VALNGLFQKLEAGQTEWKLVIAINVYKETIFVTTTGYEFYYSDTRTTCDLDSVVGIATRFRLDGSCSSPGAVKGTLLDRPSGTANLLQWVTGLFPGIKRPALGADHLLLSVAEVRTE